MNDQLQLTVKVMSVLLMAFSAGIALRQVRKNERYEAAAPGRFRWMWVAGAAIASRLVILLAGLWALDVDSLKEMWTRWDAVHYTTIVEQGYTADQTTQAWLNIVFFPLYPGMCKLLGGSFLAMLAVSWGCLAGAAVLIDRACSPGTGIWAQLWLHLFPASVFLGAPYTESLFLLTTGLTLAMVRRRKWFWAGLCGMLAALTRNLGVLTAVAFIVEYLMMHREKVEKGEDTWKNLIPAILRGGGLWCALIPLGTALYLLLNYAVYGDPLIFMQIQKDHWSQSFGFFGQTLVTSLHYALYYEEWLYRICLFIPQTVMMVVTLLTLPALLRKMSASDAMYSLVYVIFCMSPTWLLSYPRYLMGMVTLYPAMGRVLRPLWAKILVTVVFFVAMVPLTYCYLRGWPVL